MKSFIFIVIFLNLMACSQQDFTEDELLETSVNFLKYMCENRQSCLEQIDHAAKDCKNAENVFNIPPNAFGDPQMAASVELQFCIIQQMDDAFMAKYNQVFPVTETEVTITRSHETDPKVLKIEEVKGKLKILNQLIDEKELRDYISKNDLINRYESIVIISADDGDIGLILSVVDIAKNAGFDSVSITRK